MINEREIRKWWDVFKKDNPLTEIRILGNGKTFSGYFTDCETMISKLNLYDGFGIYATINEIKESCYGRSQHDTIISRPKSTTNDGDIEKRRIILLDFDPERPSDTNASNEEVKYAEQKMRSVYRYLRDQGFSAPVVAFSGNGYHLYYKIELDNTDENKDLVQNFLHALDMVFSDEKVKIDISVFNASRIAKVIGTSSNKGTNTEERPQRQSYFVHIPEEFLNTRVEYIQKIADTIPKVEPPSRFNNYSTERFDIDSFISKHGIKVTKKVRYNNGFKYVLEECPFDSNHKAPDSAIFVMDNGAIGFRCLHAHCQHYSWKDVRLKYEPNAYDKRDYEEYRQKRTYYSQVPHVTVEPIKEDERGKKWLSMKDIKWIDPSQLVSIPTGIPAIDKKIMGLTLGDLTIISGGSGAGKTTLLDHIILNAVQRGFPTGGFSAELQDFRFQAWLDQMAAGKAFVKAKPGYDNLYYAPQNVSEKINEWLDGKFWLYNNNYGSNWSQLFADIKEAVEKHGIKLILVDNLMTVNLDSYQGEKNDKQSQFINDFKSFCKQENVHGLLVCHPRKEQSFQLLRKESIAGTADLTNLCDNLIIAHRVGNDFERRAKDFFGEAKVAELMNFDLVLEMCKNRSFGVTDYLVGLYYEQETRRIKNDVAENIIYGWQEQPVQTTIDEIGDIPESVYNGNYDFEKQEDF